MSIRQSKIIERSMVDHNSIFPGLLLCHWECGTGPLTHSRLKLAVFNELFQEFSEGLAPFSGNLKGVCLRGVIPGLSRISSPYKANLLGSSTSDPRPWSRSVNPPNNAKVYHGTVPGNGKGNGEGKLKPHPNRAPNSKKAPRTYRTCARAGRKPSHEFPHMSIGCSS